MAPPRDSWAQRSIHGSASSTCMPTTSSCEVGELLGKPLVWSGARYYSSLPPGCSEEHDEMKCHDVSGNPVAENRYRLPPGSIDVFLCINCYSGFLAIHCPCPKVARRYRRSPPVTWVPSLQISEPSQSDFGSWNIQEPKSTDHALSPPGLVKRQHVRIAVGVFQQRQTPSLLFCAVPVDHSMILGPVLIFRANPSIRPTDNVVDQFERPWGF